MKLISKIILIGIAIFSLSLFLAKISIDNTFKQVECNQVDKVPPLQLLKRTEQV